VDQCRASISPSYQNTRDDQLTFLAKIFLRTMKLLERALGNFAYNFVLHTAPLQEGPLPYYHWHFEIAPRLTRLGGFESGSGFYINPTPPEESGRVPPQAENLAGRPDRASENLFAIRCFRA